MWIGPPKALRLAEAHVVDQDDDDVRGALRRLHLEPRRRLGLAGVELGDGRIRRLLDGKNRAVERLGRCRRKGRLGYAGQRDGDQDRGDEATRRPHQERVHVRPP